MMSYWNAFRRKPMPQVRDKTKGFALLMAIQPTPEELKSSLMEGGAPCVITVGTIAMQK
jgi:hypothetical protein